MMLKQAGAMLACNCGVNTFLPVRWVRVGRWREVFDWRFFSQAKSFPLPCAHWGGRVRERVCAVRMKKARLLFSSCRAVRGVGVVISCAL